MGMEIFDTAAHSVALSREVFMAVVMFETG
jgi:hypothetical protein